MRQKQIAFLFSVLTFSHSTRLMPRLHLGFKKSSLIKLGTVQVSIRRSVRCSTVFVRLFPICIGHVGLFINATFVRKIPAACHYQQEYIHYFPRFSNTILSFFPAPWATCFRNSMGSSFGRLSMRHLASSHLPTYLRALFRPSSSDL